MEHETKPLKGGRWNYRGCKLVLDMSGDDLRGVCCVRNVPHRIAKKWGGPVPDFPSIKAAREWVDGVLNGTLTTAAVAESAKTESTQTEAATTSPASDAPTTVLVTPSESQSNPAADSTPIVPAVAPDPEPESIKVSASVRDLPLVPRVASKGPEKPENAATVRTYARFEQTLDSFASKVRDPKGFKFLLIIGKGGKGKTECVKAALERHGYAENVPDTGYGYRRGKLTGFELYKFLYQFRDQPIVLDDINDMMRDRTAPSIIQAATETRLPRAIQYGSAHRDIGFDDDQTPPMFRSSSPVIIIANEWASTNHVIKSIETRAYTIYFNPSNEEVHNVYVPTWFGKSPDEKAVYDFIGEWIAHVPNLNCRTYTLGQQLHYNRPESWDEELTSALVPDNLFSECLAIKLLNDKSFATDKERIEEFVKRGGGGIATFKRIKAALGLSRQNRPATGEDGRKTRHSSEVPPADQQADEPSP